ncbi:type VI secretion protein VasK, partial [Cupriavidus sp. 2MCAB6]
MHRPRVLQAIMNEYKPQPVARYLCIAILSLFVAVGLAVWFEGPGQGLSRQQVKLFEISLAIGCIVSLLLARYYEWLALKIQLLRARLWVANYDASKRSEAATAGGGAPAARPGRLATIRDALHVHHGWRWRYRQPWLLLTGDDAAIARLLPELAEQGWLITPDAVLLWSKANKEGWPDADWLKQLYRLRRRRPVDAVILTMDSATDLQVQRRGTHPDGMRLARIAELLRWSAPVYLLDVAEARTVGHGLMPVISCELPRQADADAIDDALRTLRDQLAQRVVAQLMAGNRDRYMGELSQRLDTRGKALADWIAGLGGRQRRRIAVEGIVFAPYPRPIAGDASVQSSVDLPLWHYLGEAARRQPGQRVGWHPVTVSAIVGLTAIGLWGAGMLVSGVLNGRDIHAARQSVNDFQSA